MRQSMYILRKTNYALFQPLLSIFVFLITFYVLGASSEAVTLTTLWGGDTEMVYDTGFMHMLMKHPDGGVCLFNMDLIENDSPGGGASEKGVYNDVIWGKNRARKILYLNDNRAEKAFLLIYFGRGKMGKYPLQFTINGHQTRMDTWDPSTFHLAYRWIEFPVKWLKKGSNIIELFCPEAQSEKEGWNIYISRADEFETGGGNPKNVGKTSFKSKNGGKSWKESPFGLDGKTRAEYTIRISFDRYVKTGWLASPVIDLWKGDSEDFIVPMRVFKKMKLSVDAEVPEGTKVEYFLRTGINPGPFSEGWEHYELIGTGKSIDSEFSDRVIKGRYIQLKVVISTSNPLISPVIKSAHITAELLQGNSSHKSIKVARVENPVIRYSSVNWEWEKWKRPEFKELCKRENLDSIIAGSKTQFEAIIKFLELATTRVPRKYATPFPYYPGWDALSILDRIDKHGSVGMCIQFNNLLEGYCMAYGMQGRLINGMDHEMAEVWSDDFGKWVYLEASYANHYMASTETGEPMSLLDLHNAYLDYFYPDRPIDWMNDFTDFHYAAEEIEKRDDKPPVMRSSTTYHQTDNPTITYKGFIQSTFMRMVPRNNFYEKPYPIPLSHGIIGCWLWNGYINWYDDRTPPMRQYSWYTDRPRDMWPDLNLVCVHATTGHSNKFLFLRFETYTPNFSHFEVYENNTGWNQVDSDRWTWVLASGKSTLRVRAVNKLGAKGKPSEFEVYRADVPLENLY